MKKIKLMALACLIISNISQAQTGDNIQKKLSDTGDGYEDGGCRNLVTNPSFEIYTPLPGPTATNTCYSDINRAYGWENIKLGSFYHGGTPDLYYVGQPVSGTGSGCEHCAVTTGDYAVQPVSSPPLWGNTTQAYAGLGLYYKRPGVTNSLDHSREYMVVKLRDPLLSGVTYNINMKASLGESSLYSLPLQVYFTNSPNFTSGISGNTAAFVNLNNGSGGLVPLSPSVTSASTWTDVSASVTPAAGTSYGYMVIGNFRNNFDTESLMATESLAPWGGINEWSIYYLIDEVSVTANCPAQVYLGGCNTQGFFDINSGNPLPVPEEPISTLLSSIPAGTTSIYIDYPILIDVNYSILSKDITFGPSGKLIVPSGKTLTIGNSTLHGCYSMWDGIDVRAGGSISCYSSTIEDAIIAIETNNAASFNIINSTFNKNKQHIFIENHTSASTKNMYGNIFKCTANLKYPMDTETTSDAVTFKNCTQDMRFGTETSGLAGNNVSQAVIGVNIISSNVGVYKNTFSNITGTSNLSWAVRGNHSATVGNFRTIKVGGPTVEYKNTFSNCNNGVYLTGNHKSVVEGNTFTTVTITALEISNTLPLTATASTTTQASDGDYMVLQNTITNCYHGIRFYNNGNARILVSGNTVRHLTSNPPVGSTGIYLAERINMTGLCRYWDANFTREKLITGNTVQRFDHAILTNTSSCVWITSNIVLMSTPETVQHHGIRYSNTRYTFVYKNEVQANRLGWQTLGIRAESTNDAECGCNKITRTGYAQINAGWHNAAKIYSNRIDNTEQGISVWGGGVGVQIPGYRGSNEWLNVQPVGTQTRHFWADGTTTSSHSTFYLPTAVSSLNPPANTYAASGSIAISKLNIDYPAFSRCDQDAPTWINAQRSMETELTGGIRVEEGGQALQDKLALLRVINDNNWSKSSDVISRFVKSNTHASQLVLAEKEFSNGNYKASLSILSSFTPENEYEEVYKDWQYMLAAKASSISGFAAEDVPALVKVAQLCELEYGMPVYAARTILLNEFPEETYETSTCNLIRDNNPGSLAQEKLEKQTNNYFLLSPNPAGDYINIENSFKVDAVYAITNNMGAVLLTGKAPLGKTMVSVSSLLPGNYTCTFMNVTTKEILETDMMIINR